MANFSRGTREEKVSIPTVVASVSSLKGKVTFLESVMYVVIFVLLVSLSAAVASYFMMVQNAFINYENTVNEFRSEKYKNIESRIEILEKSTIPSSTTP